MPRTASSNSRNDKPRSELDFDDDNIRAVADAKDDDVSADDLAPETLLDEEGTHTSDGPADQGLRETRASTIGAGGGLDEAELADTQPVGKSEAERLKRKADEHANDPNAFEPAEAAEVASRNKKKR
ncbi:hypothetical protein [Hydrocarboniphaga sp.]|uniref:hypothetical protein n=1 Tax=Hydrocarboniphaga sp. TaxID=2033016 RepID=UPI003D11933C